MDKLTRLFCKLVTHDIFGKIIGASFFCIPLYFLYLRIESYEFNYVTIIMAIILIYVGLFLGGILHEIGHITTLRLLGGKSKIKLMWNDHSKIIFFNMKTEIINDHPKFSTLKNLLIRGISGLLSNVFFMVLFLVIGLTINSKMMIVLSIMQGISAHGATSISKKIGDTDVATINRALNLNEEYDLDIGENTISMTLHLNQNEKMKDNYWVYVFGKKREIEIISEHFIVFPTKDGNILINTEINDNEEFNITFKNKVKSDEKIKLLTKYGNKLELV